MAPVQPIPLPKTTVDCSTRTLVMGVVNITPDSFSDGGVHYRAESAIQGGLDMLAAGADIVDMGGESTRPGSLPVEEDEEIRRVKPVIEAVIREEPNAVISIDTRRRAVAEMAVKAGAQIINDVSGFRDDPSMIDFAVETGCAVVVMHMLGRPRTMQRKIRYDAFPEDIYLFFRERIATLEQAGVAPEKIIIDPGIGFGKTFDQNLILINRLDFFADLGKPLLLGASRKSFIGKILDEPVAANRDTGSLAVMTAGILRGAHIVRVHDVPASIQAARVADAVARERTAA